MIDLHSHLLPGIDDGAPDLATSLAMARIAVADGIECMACTPHIYPGVYDNRGPDILDRVGRLQRELDGAGIPLRLTTGADAHLAPDLLARLRSGEAPTLARGRYVLLEPPHHVAPPRFEEVVFSLVAAGYVPVVTHPERLTWIGDHYDSFCRLVDQGAWMQVTSGSLTGRFGRDAAYWGERMLDEGRVHILATDAHGVDVRAPLLAEGRRAAEKWVGAAEAEHLVVTRPRGILHNVDAASLPALPAGPRRGRVARWARSLFGRDS